MSTFTNILKNIFWILILLQITPTLITSIKTQYSDMIESKTKVGLIDIKSTIYSSTTYVQKLRKLFKNDEIKAIVLRIDSPGGAAGASQNIFNEIKVLKCLYNKYVIAFVENIAASGGYYIASASDHIISSPAAFIGSIGSYIAHPNFKEFIENYNIKYEVIKSGEYKTAGNPLLNLTEDQKNMLQELSNNVYSQFVNDVASQRKNLAKDSNIWANGKIFTGEQALNLKLIDELGSQSNVKYTLEQKANIKGAIEWVTPEKKIGLLYSIFSDDDQNSSLSSFIKTVFKTVKAESSQDSISANY